MPRTRSISQWLVEDIKYPWWKKLWRRLRMGRWRFEQGETQVLCGPDRILHPTPEQAEQIERRFRELQKDCFK